jgi:hypothetical protein
MILQRRAPRERHLLASSRTKESQMGDTIKPGRARRVMAVFVAAGMGFYLGLVLALPGGFTVAVMSASDGAMYGLVLGIVGVSASSYARANMTGILIGGLPGALLLTLSILGTSQLPIRAAVWFLAGGCSFGSVCAQVGAAIGGPSLQFDESSNAARPRVKRLVTFVIPLAILLLGFLISLVYP